MDLEAVLRSRLLWDAGEPSPEALASTQPFCIDTLDFPQWLQFVFLPRMQALLDADLPLPAQCAVAEMAEMHFGAAEAADVIALLREIDLAVVAASP
ncbi:MAG TPA: YqcC family protein [Pseudomonadales bacterium]|nr:YqcC family protein [Pseudomonadales bacterium]